MKLYQYIKEYFKKSLDQYLDEIFDDVRWTGDKENWVNYECELRVKEKDEFDKREEKLINDLSNLVEAFKVYTRDLPTIKEKEYIFE